jgi:Flp pilus assembly protein TadG
MTERGATVVEFAIVGLLLFMLIVGLIDFAIIEAGNSAVSNAARDGARAGIVDTDCVDAYTGSGSPGGSTDYGVCTADTNSDYTAVKTAVLARLGGLATSPTISIACVDNDSSDANVGQQEACISEADALAAGHTSRLSYYVPNTDLLEVTVTYTSAATSPFVTPSARTQSAHMIILGSPAIPSATSSTTSTSSTSTTATSVTTTTAVPTTTTPPTTSSTTTVAPTSTTVCHGKSGNCT